MKITSLLRNLPFGIRFLHSIRQYDYGVKIIEDARAAGDAVEERRCTAELVHHWAATTCERFGITVEVTGQENIPEEDGFVVIANHQGYLDIVALMYAFEGHQIGFIAKDNLEKVPYISKWIRMSRGYFIKRGDARASLKTIQKGIEDVKKGYNMVIFPEGTRSKCSETGEFKGGSFKLATKAKAPILPVAMNGSYHFFEDTGVVKPCTVTMEILPPVETAGLDRKAISAVEAKLYEDIRASVRRQAIAAGDLTEGALLPEGPAQPDAGDMPAADDRPVDKGQPEENAQA